MSNADNDLSVPTSEGSQGGFSWHDVTITIVTSHSFIVAQPLRGRAWYAMPFQCCPRCRVQNCMWEKNPTMYTLSQCVDPQTCGRGCSTIVIVLPTSMLWQCWCAGAAHTHMHRLTPWTASTYSGITRGWECTSQQLLQRLHREGTWHHTWAEVARSVTRPSATLHILTSSSSSYLLRWINSMHITTLVGTVL